MSYHLNGEKIASDFLSDNIGKCAISRITYVEVLSFDFSEEEVSEVKELLENFIIYDTNAAIGIQCLKNRRCKKIKIPDNLIAATAQINDLILVTRNVEDFRQLDLRVLNILD